MIAMLVIALIVLTLAGYIAGTLTVATETPVSQWDSGIAYWANRARFYETGPLAGMVRKAEHNDGYWTMPCPCGRAVPCVHGTFADGWGVYCDAQCMARYGENLALVPGTYSDYRECVLLHDVSSCTSNCDAGNRVAF